MNWNEAFSEAILGARITAPTIQTGAYVDYQFNGLRIVFPSGSNSGFSPTDADKAAEWTVDTMDPPMVPLQDRPQPANVGKWGLPRIELGEHGVPPKPDAWGRPNDPKYIAAVDDLIGETNVGVSPRFARPPQPKTPKLSGFEIAQLQAKVDKEPEPSKWGNAELPKERDKWGR